MVQISRHPLLTLTPLALALSMALVPAAHAADDAKMAALEQKLQESLDLIKKLSDRVAELEKSKSAPAPAPAAVSGGETARIEALERDVRQMAASAAQSNSSNDGLPLHGFIDVGYQRSGYQPGDGRKNGYQLGNVDFYLTPQFSDRVKGLVELNFDWTPESTFSVDTERMQLGYTFSDELTVWMGRFHTPYGFWNTAYHHGAQLQTSATRPRFINFEDKGGIMPSHTVGIWATGQTRMGDGKLTYDAFVGNGQRLLAGLLDFNAVKDDNSNHIFGGNLGYRFGGSLDGLVLGVHAFNEEVNSYADPGGDPATLLGRTRVGMLGYYGFYDNYDWEILGEYYHFSNSDLSNGTGNHQSWAGFLQVGRNIGYSLIPYMRFEKAKLDQSDTYFGTQVDGRSYDRSVFGVRYDLNAKTALKLEWRHTRDDALGNFGEVQVQAATRF